MDEYKPTRQMLWFGCQWWLVILLAVLVITITGGIVSFGLNWFNAGKDIISPDNVREQWRFAYEYEEGLQAAAMQVCNAQEAYDMASSDKERSQRLTYLQGYKNNYASMAADYNARMRNNFEAGLVKPKDVRERALPLETLLLEFCP